MNERPPSEFEIALALAILLSLGLVLLLGACTYTRGPCTVTKDVKVVFVCEKEGKVINIDFTP